MSELPAVLEVKELGGGRWTAPHPVDDPEGRDVVFSGQMLAQMIMISSAAAGPEGEKEVKSVHGVFARSGSYSGGPLEYSRESMHSGRAWASDTITVRQGDRLLARGLVLLNAVEPDLMRHGPPMPEVAGPEEGTAEEINVIYPGADVRRVEPAGAGAGRPSPSVCVWVRYPGSFASVAPNQAIVAWCEPGLIIGAAMSVHPDAVDIGAAHRSISTGVISHTAHFHEHADVGDWLLYVHDASYAGHGRVFGSGAVFTRDGALVSTFAQDSMARSVDRPLDWRKDM